MQSRKKRKIIIATLCAVIVGMTVGYSVLSQLLNINGTSQVLADFNIQFTKIDENTMVNAKTITKGGVGTTTANFTVDLEKPGSSAIYDLTVSNLGTIDAILTSIEGLDESNNQEPLDITFSLVGIKQGDSLNAGESKMFQVKVDWDKSSSTIPSNSKKLVLTLNYEQKSGTNVETTPESCFTMDGGTITGYNCNDTEIVIPSTINGIPVTAIGREAMAYKQLTSVELPRGLETINFMAFEGNSLTHITIPEGVTTIVMRAFGSNQLTSVDLPSSLRSLNGFDQNKLSSIVIPVGVTEIGYNAFSSNQLTSVEIPNSVTSIGGSSFSGNQLTSVKISDSVTSIDESAFSGNQLTSVEIPNSVTSIGNNAFYDNQLTSVVIPNSVTSIGDYAFTNNQLTSVVIPDSVTTINSYAFSHNQLTSVVIPDSVTSINSFAFSNNQLTTVTIGSNVQTIDSYAFQISTNATNPSNPNLTKIINKSGNAFNWYEITRQGAYQSAVTGTFGQVIVTAE